MAKTPAKPLKKTAPKKSAPPEPLRHATAKPPLPKKRSSTMTAEEIQGQQSRPADDAARGAGSGEEAIELRQAVVFDPPAVSMAERRNQLLAEAEANQEANDKAYEEQVEALRKFAAK